MTRLDHLHDWGLAAGAGAMCLRVVRINCKQSGILDLVGDDLAIVSLVLFGLMPLISYCSNKSGWTSRGLLSLDSWTLGAVKEWLRAITKRSVQGH